MHLRDLIPLLFNHANSLDKLLLHEKETFQVENFLTYLGVDVTKNVYFSPIHPLRP